jgi:serine/threonine protein kinase/tetratricopeptide (TPR) repeat protein
MKAASDSDLLSALPQPIARAWAQALARSDPQGRTAALLEARNLASTFVRNVVHAARHADCAPLAEWGEEVERALASPTPTADGAAWPEREVRAQLGRLIEPGAPQLLAAAGNWSVRLAGPSSALDFAQAAGTFGLAVAFRDRVIRLDAASVYDPDNDEVLLERAASGAGFPPAPPTPAPPAGGMDTTPFALLEGRRFGPFRLLREVKTGGQGTLYEAQQDVPRRIVALKTLADHLALDTAAHRRMREEADTLASMDHRNIVPVLDAGVWQGQPWIAMPFIRGRSLAEAIEALAVLDQEGISEADWQRAVGAGAGEPAAERRSHVRAVAQMGRDVARALDACHDRGLVHRDVKPANLMFESDGTVLLTDFGLARSLDPRSLTQSDQVVGTLYYLSPEALNPGSRAGPDRRMDLYGLGSTLYEALALRRPLADHEQGGGTLMDAILHESPPPFRRLVRGVPGDLETIVMKCLEKSPDARYATAGDLAEDLDRFLTNQPIRARPPGRVDRARKLMRRHPVASVAVGALVFAGLTVLAFLLSRNWLERTSRLEGQELARRQESERKLAGLRATLRELETPGEAVHTELETLFRMVRNADAETVGSIVAALDARTDEIKRRTSGADAAPRRPTEAVPYRSPDEAFPGAERAARLCAEALGRIGFAGSAVPALERHLEVQHVREVAIAAGVALARLCGADDGQAALDAMRRVLVLPHLAAMPGFADDVRAFLPVALSGTADADAGVAMLVAPPRVVHGTIPDPATGAHLMAPALVESWMGFGLPGDNRDEGRDQIRALLLQVEAQPKDARLWRALALARYDTGDVPGAIADLSAALDFAPNDHDLLHERARARRLVGQFAGSIHDLDRALELAPTIDSQLISRGLTRVDQGDTEGALRDLTAAQIRAPHSYYVRLYRSMAHLCSGDTGAAEADALASLGLDPMATEARNCLAITYLHHGKHEAALQEARTVVKVASRYSLGWNTLGVVLYLSGAPQEAEVAWKSAVKTDPRLPFPWVNLGVLSLARGDPASARGHFAAAIDRVPRLPTPWLGRAVASRAHADLEDARFALSVLRRLSPGDPAVADVEAFLHRRPARR